MLEDDAFMGEQRGLFGGHVNAAVRIERIQITQRNARRGKARDPGAINRGLGQPGMEDIDQNLHKYSREKSEKPILGRAAARLNLKPSTVSHRLGALEERLGVRLLHRTTRSVALSEAGRALFGQVAPALGQLATALASVHGHRDRPRGCVRLSLPRCVATMVLLPRLRDFCARHPNIHLDITADNRAIDIVRDGFDAGIRLGGNLAGDTVAVPLTGELHSVIAN